MRPARIAYHGNMKSMKIEQKKETRLTAPVPPHAASTSPAAAGVSIDVALAPSLLPPVTHPAIYIVVDVLRATSTLCVLFEGGCHLARVVRTVDEARTAKAQGVPGLLVGEVGGLRPEGFDLGNSPREMRTDIISGQEIVFATTNGTRALHACVSPEADAIFAGSFRNATAVAEAALEACVRVVRERGGREEQPENVRWPHPDDVANIIVVCAGLGNRPALDDTLCAGYLAERVAALAPTHGVEARLLQGARVASFCLDGAREREGLERAFAAAPAAVALERVGLGADVAECAAIDVSRAVPEVVLPAQTGEPLLMRAMSQR